MATDKRFVVKNGLQTENINFVFNDAVVGSSNITATMLSSNVLSFSGTSGQLFSIADTMTGVIFAVNDISGVPSIEVYDDGRIRMAESFGNVIIGNSTINTSRTSTSTSTGILQVAGGAGIQGNINVGGTRNLFTGFVGVGTSTVDGINSNVFSVYGTQMLYGNLDLTNPTGGTSGIYFADGTYQITAATAGQTSSGIAGTVQFSGGSGTFAGDATNFFWDDANNRLGIGSSAPSNTLTVWGATPAWFNTTNGSNIFEVFVGNATTTGATLGYASTPLNPYSYVRNVGGTVGVVVLNSGSVGIRGITNPQNALDVGGAVAVGSSYAGVRTAPTNGMIVQTSVGIGTFSVASILDVWGIGSFTSAISAGGTASVSALISNNNIFGTTLNTSGQATLASSVINTNTTTSSLNVQNNALVGSINSNTNVVGVNLQSTGLSSLAALNVNAGTYTNSLNVNTTANVNALTSNTGITVSAGGITVTGTGQFTGNVNITGNLNVTGAINTQSANVLVINDPLIYIGENNQSNIWDLGIVASYNSGTYYHTGLVRNRNDGAWTLFDTLVTEPNASIGNINWSDSSITFGPMKVGNLTIMGNTRSTSSSTGALVMNGLGGIGVGGNIYVGGQQSGITGNLWINGSNASTSTATGAFVVTGGAGIGGNIYVGNNVNLGTDTGRLMFGASADTILSRPAPATLQMGAVDAASPVAQNLKVQSVVAGTSNTAGVNLTIDGSRGTGTGGGGSIIFRVAPAGASGGTAQNSLANLVQIVSPQSGQSTNALNFGWNGNGPMVYGTNIGIGNGINTYNLYAPSGVAGFAVGGTDAYLTRRGSNNLRLGSADVAAPAAQTLSVQSVASGTADTPGPDLTLTGSQGTGLGVGGNIILQVASANTVTSTTQNTFQTALRIDSNRNVLIPGNLSVANAATFGSFVSNGTIQTAGAIIANSANVNTSISTNSLNVGSGGIIASSLVSNGAVSGTNGTFTGALYGGSFNTAGTATVNALVSNGAISGTTMNGTAATFTSLQVSGTTTTNALVSNVYGLFGQNVTVNSTNASTSATTGALVVAGGIGVSGALIAGGYILTNQNATVLSANVSTSTSTGALIIGNAAANFGGLGVAGNINVGGQRSVFSGNISVLGSNAATSSTTGALIVTNGAGIGGDLYTGGAIISGVYVLATQNVRISSTNAATSSTTGALVVSGGAGVAGAIIGGSYGLFAQNVTVNSTNASTSTTTGALVVGGGIGAAGNVVAGTFQPTSATLPVNGMFLPAANTLGFATNSTEDMRLTANGNLLLGTTTAPSGGTATMVLRGFGTNGSGIEFSNVNVAGANVGIGGGNSLVFSTFIGAIGSEAYTERMRLDQLGNLAIGTSTITAGTRLMVAGGNITVNTSGFGVVFPDGTFQTTAATAGATASGVAGTVQFSNGSGGFSGDAANFFWDNGNKRLGIGSSSPTNTLTVWGGNPAWFNTTNGSNIFEIFVGNAVTTAATLGYASTPLNPYSYIRNVGGTVGVVVLNNGSVGVRGITNPQNALDVGGALAIGNSYAGVRTAPTNGQIVQGSVGIGTFAVASTLDVWGIGSFTSAISAGGTASVSALISNNNIFGSTLNTSGLAQLASLNVNAGTYTNTLNVNTTANVNALTSNTGITVTNGGIMVTGLSTFTGNVGITGNLNVTGTINTQNANVLVVNDPIIYLGEGNTSNLWDLGIIANYNDGVYEHTGLVRNRNDGIWTLFDNMTSEPNVSTGNINWNDSTLTFAPMKLGNLTVAGNTRSTSSTSGAIVLGGLGGIGVGGNIYVGGQQNGISGNLWIAGSNASTTSATGALVVTNGVGIGGALNVGGQIYTAGALNAGGTAIVNALTSNGAVSGTTGTFTGALYGASFNTAGTATVNALVSNGAISGTMINGTAGTFTSLQVSGTTTTNALISNVYGLFGQNVTINSTNTSTSTTTGALILAGGAGVAGNINVGGTINYFAGNVGIGITSPISKLHTYQTITSSQVSAAILGAAYSVGNLSHGLGFSINNNAASAGLYVTDSGAGSASLTFTTSPSFTSPTNTERMRINGNGNLLVGTTSAPSGGTATMVLQGVGTNGSGIEFSNVNVAGANVGIGGSNSLVFSTYTGAVGSETYTERMRLLSNGNFGIGTASPETALHLNNPSAGGDTPRIRFTNTNTGTGATDGAFVGISNNNQLDIYNFEASSVRIATSNNERMRVDANGNVGINNTSPLYRVHVNNVATVGTSASILSNAQPILYLDNGSGIGGSIVIKSHSPGNGNQVGAIKFAASPDASNYSWAGMAGIADTNAAASALAFYTAASNGQATAAGASTERMRIDINGNFLVGLTSGTDSTPSGGQFAGPMLIGGYLSTDQTNRAVLQYFSNEVSLRAYGATSGTGYITLRTGGGGNAADTERMRINSGGNVLIGTTTTPAGGTATVVIQGVGTNGSGIQFSNVNVAGANVGIGGSNSLVFSTYTGAVGSETYTERMRINTGNVNFSTNLTVNTGTTSLFGGNVGIGTASSLGATGNVFSVYGSENLYGNLVIRSTVAGGAGVYFPDGTFQTTAATGGGGSGATVYTFSYTGNGTTTAYGTSPYTGAVSTTDVFVNGVYQRKSTYTWVGTTLTFSSAPPNFSTIEINILASAGNVSTLASQVRQTFTAGSGQTAFTVTGGYASGQIDIYQNGSKLNVGTDVIAIDGSSFTLSNPARVGDTIEIVALYGVLASFPNAYPITGGVLSGNMTVGGGAISTSSSTGAIVIGSSGGIGVGGNINVGGTRSTFTGFVGVGAASVPNYALDVTGEVAIRGGEGVDDARVYFQASDNSNRFTIETDLDGTTSNDLLGFRSTSVDNMLVLKGNGTIGISTNAPGSTLDVNGIASFRSDVSAAGRITTASLVSNTNIFSATMSTSGVAQFASVTSNAAVTATGFIPSGAAAPTNGMYLPTTNTVGFSTNSVERMRITATGNVIMGTSASTTTQASLMVSGNTNNSAVALAALDAATISIKNDSVGGLGLTSKLNFNVAAIGASVVAGYYAAFNASNDIGTGLQFGTQTNAAGGTVERMRIDQFGNVSIGTSSAFYQSGGRTVLSVNGSSAAMVAIGTGGTQKGYVHFDGTNLNVQSDSGALGLATSTANPVVIYTNGVERMRIDSSGNVGIGTSTITTGYRLQVQGGFAATTKSFVIKHPTKPGMLLRHGSLEGPENGVYVRGRSTETVIRLPDYWEGLVDMDTVTVNITPIGSSQSIYVRDIRDNLVYLGSADGHRMEYFYTVFAERRDVSKLTVEE